MSPGAENMKTGFDALGTAENESDRAEHENETDTLGTAKNESGSAKYGNWTRRHRYRRKRVREHKT
jgi:homoserine kinase